MRRLRSLLFVPGDRPERMQKALGLGADALILDLEDAVAPTKKEEARTAVVAFLRVRSGTGPALFVRVNPIDGEEVAADLAALVGVPLDGIVLPKACGAASIDALTARLPGDYKVLPVASETPAAVFQLGNYRGDRLAGLTWGVEDLPAAIGAATSRETDGSYTDPYKVVRALVLFGAHAADVPAIETIMPDFRNVEALASYAARGRRDGFTGMMAIHPAQVPIINAAFTPSTEEIAHAQAVISLFDANPGAGVLQMDGKMIDAPHLKAAHRLLSQV